MAQIVGVFRIGRDAEVRFTQGGDPVASLSLVFNHGKKEADGNKPSQWIDASLWGKRAEATAPYLLKGSMIYAVIGDPHIETYQGKNGEGHKLVGKVLEIEFAGSKSGGVADMDEPAQHRASRQAMDAQRPTGGEFDGNVLSDSPCHNQPSGAMAQGARVIGAGARGFDDMDDDIPF